MQSSPRCLFLLWLALSAVTGATAIAAESIGYFEAITSDPLPVVGQQYYTRHCFMYEKGVSDATNYWRGSLVSINTQVTLVSLDDRSMLLRLKSGETVKIESEERHSRRSMATVAHNLLTPQPVPVDKFDEAIASAIRSGTLKLGMTKEQVVMARGYPPGHKTPSLDSDRWCYWTSRYAEQTIAFSNGVLVRGRGIY